MKKNLHNIYKRRFNYGCVEKYPKLQGMSQRDLAQLMGCTQNEVSRWCGGGHNFTLKTLANQL